MNNNVPKCNTDKGSVMFTPVSKQAFGTSQWSDSVRFCRSKPLDLWVHQRLFSVLELINMI